MARYISSKRGIIAGETVFLLLSKQIACEKAIYHHMNK